MFIVASRPVAQGTGRFGGWAELRYAPTMTRARRLLPALFGLSLLPLSASGCSVTVNEGSSAKPDAADAGQDGDGAGPGEDGDAADEDGGEGADDGPAPTIETASATEALPPCPEQARGESYCTEDGKLAGEWMPVDMLRVPEDAQVIFEASEGPTAGGSRQPSLTIAVDGEMIYLRHVTCGACRRELGDGFRGQLSAMTAEQTQAMQAKLGLDASMPVLDTAEKWENFASDARGEPALKAIASKTDRDP